MSKMKIVKFYGAFLMSMILSNGHAEKITIVQFIEHPSLTKIRNGITDTILEKEADTIISYKNSHGNMGLNAQIASSVSNENNDVIITITTPSTQAVKKHSHEIPIVFAAVSNPYESKIMTADTAENITGIYDEPLSKKLLEFALTLKPNIQKIGVIYNPGETNSVSFLNELKEAANNKGVQIIAKSISKLSDISAATDSLIHEVDSVMLGNDNMVISGIDSIIKICEQNSVPLFTSDPESVEKGAYAALAYDQYDIGRKAGKIVLRIMNHENAKDIPIEKPDKIVKVFNEKTAKKLKLPYHS